LLLQPPRLTGKDQRRKPAQSLLDPGEPSLVRITRHLPDRQTAPAVGGPSFAHTGGRSAHASPPRLEVAHHRRHSDQQEHETRKPPRWGGFGINAQARSWAAYIYRRYQNRANWQEPRTALTCSITARYR